MHLPGFAPRSTTPPLYYHRPEGVPPSYVAAPTADVEPLNISTNIPRQPLVSVPCQRPSKNGPYAASAAPPSLPMRSSLSLAPPPPSPRNSTAYVLPAVTNPFASPPNAGSMPMPPPATFGRGWPPTAATPRESSGSWSYPQSAQGEAARLAALQNDEMSLAAEEAALRATLADLRMTQRGLEEEQLQLSQGWSLLLEREERYYTEPLLDLSADIAAREQQCLSLGEVCGQTEAHAYQLEEQLQQTNYVLQDRAQMEGALARVRDGLEALNARRRRCAMVAERYFDAESKRVAFANRAVRVLATQLRDMSVSGPLATLNRDPRTSGAPAGSSRSGSRGVTFCVDQQSIVLDGGVEEGSATAGLSLDNQSTQQPVAPRPNSSALTEHSLCLGLGAEDEDEFSVGGPSVAISLNNSNQSSWKRHKAEAPAHAITAA